MARDDLEQIKDDLENAHDYQRSARKRAERVGDKEGAARIKEAEEKNDEVRKSFDKDL